MIIILVNIFTLKQKFIPGTTTPENFMTFILTIKKTDTACFFLLLDLYEAAWGDGKGTVFPHLPPLGACP